MDRPCRLGRSGGGINLSERVMSKVVYEIVEHDGGWAYRSDGVYSETFTSHDAARAAAIRVAREQKVPGTDAAISFETPDGKWHEELVDGHDRPITEVKG
jgi:hypothetical protein